MVSNNWDLQTQWTNLFLVAFVRNNLSLLSMNANFGFLWYSLSFIIIELSYLFPTSLHDLLCRWNVHDGSRSGSQTCWVLDIVWSSNYLQELLQNMEAIKGWSWLNYFVGKRSMRKETSVYGKRNSMPINVKKGSILLSGCAKLEIPMTCGMYLYVSSLYSSLSTLHNNYTWMIKIMELEWCFY